MKDNNKYREIVRFDGLRFFYRGVQYVGKISNDPNTTYEQLVNVGSPLKELAIHNLKFLGIFKTPDSSGDIFKDISEKEDKWSWYPFKPIPNVRSFEVRLTGFDPLFAMFNIRKRFKPQIEFEKYINHSMNRYMEHQLVRLEKIKATGNSVLYFKVCEILMRHSRVFFINQLNNTFGKGHRLVPFHLVKIGFYQYKKIQKEPLGRIEYHRTFIPKANGKRRPLGVPTMSGRIYLGLGNKFMLKGLRGRLSVYQHAYQPKKGTISAGRQIIQLVGSRNIYSADLSKYFDKVSLSYCTKVLHERFEVPLPVCQYLKGIHLVLPYNYAENEYEPIHNKQGLARLLEEYNIPPRNVLRNYNDPRALRKGLGDISPLDIDKKTAQPELKFGKGYWYDPTDPNGLSKAIKGLTNFKVAKGYKVSEVLAIFENRKFRQKYLAPGLPQLSRDLIKPKSFEDLLQPGRDNGFFPLPEVSGERIGVPQGAPISPLLAIMALEGNYFDMNTDKSTGTQVVQYSDDLLFFSDDDKKSFKDLPEHGVIHSPEKSYGVKKNGKGLRPLDFLGLRYVPWELFGLLGGTSHLDQTLRRKKVREGVIMAHTRNGSELVFDKSRLVELLDYRNYEERSKDDTIVGCSDCAPYGKCLRPMSCQRLYREKHHVTLHDLIRNRIFGLIQARLYLGNGNLEDFKQDFRLTFKRGTGVSYNKKFIRANDINVFTSTSFASYALFTALSNYKSKGKGTGSASLFNSRSYVGKGSTKEKEKQLVMKEDFKGVRRVQTDRNINKQKGAEGRNKRGLHTKVEVIERYKTRMILIKMVNMPYIVGLQLVASYLVLFLAGVFVDYPLTGFIDGLTLDCGPYGVIRWIIYLGFAACVVILNILFGICNMDLIRLI